MTALLVVGSAPCAYDDLEAAKKLFPNAEVMAVNGACTMVEEIDHMLAGHTSKAEEFANARRAAFPGAPMPKVHANTRSKRESQRDYPSVTDWHGPDVSSGATSAGKAAMIGMNLGYAPIVLCGCPLDGSGYSFEEAAVSQDKSCKRVGDAKVQHCRSVKGYRERMVALAQSVFKGRVFSMSGFTREHLGAPVGT